MSISWGQLVNDAGSAAAFNAVPVGQYDLQVESASFKMTASGKKMYSVKYRIMGGPHNNRVIFDNIVLTTDNSTALGFFFRKMAALGLDMEYFKSNPTDEAITAAMTGRTVRVDMGIRQYQGEDQNEIKNYLKPPAGGAAPGPGGVAAPPPPPMAAAPAPAAPPPPPVYAAPAQPVYAAPPVAAQQPVAAPWDASVAPVAAPVAPQAAAAPAVPPPPF